MSRLAFRVLAAPLLFACTTAPAHAHIVNARLGDFYAGALHPLTGLEDGLAWLALALAAALHGSRAARWLVPAVPLGLVAGFALGLALGVAAVPAVVSAAVLVALGVLAAAHVRLPTPALVAAGAALGVVRGVANAGGVAADTNVVLYGAGLALVGYVVITLLAALLVAFRDGRLAPAAGPAPVAAAAAPGHDWRAIALRTGASWLAAIGLMIGGFALAG
jgi:hydrogenase/urease accessory protein HupE